jgi:alpha-ketoglutarate-dependent taurine dioxygenase
VPAAPKGTIVSQLFSTAPLGERRFPVLFEPRRELSLLDLAHAHAQALRESLVAHGAVLLRGFRDSERLFGEFVGAISADRLPYVYRSTPRKTIAENIYTATIYPAHQSIPFHCENSYQRDWPMLLAFCCIEPAAQGGATPLADVAGVTRSLPSTLVDEFRTRRVRYDRYYRTGTDLPWQDVFQTTRREAVSEFCTAQGIECVWHGADELATTHICQGTAVHPVLGTQLWFNQANLFHPCSLERELEDSLVQLFGPDKLPRNAHFGDGGQIDRRALHLVRAAFEQNATSFQWRRADVLLVDNMQIAHGRTAFTGRRNVLVAMSNSHAGLMRRLNGAMQ